MTAEEREAFDATLEAAREHATVEERDGRTFTVVRLPDRYGDAGPTGGSRRDRLSALDTVDDSD